MQIDVHQHGAITVVSPLGAITSESAALVRARINEVTAASAGRVAVDCSGIPLVDSEGLETLVGLSESLENLGHTLRLVNANATFRETTVITGTDHLFEYFADAGSAARSLL